MSDPKHLAQIKNQLADKYDHLSRLTSSKPKQRALSRRAAKHRRQAVELERRAAQTK
ncbi:MAG: hypothetical protein ACF8PG_00645 [Maioricimonas sp. JB045]|uniref:hypothetical protein n=1 Tax=Maioricimonas sp. JC845 TaxID=3232138 RepID=UPI00345ACAC0